jgi:hypothetical protein
MVHEAQHIPGSAELMNTDFGMQYDDIPLDGGDTKVLQGSTTVLCINGEVSINVGQYLCV